MKEWTDKLPEEEPKPFKIFGWCDFIGLSLPKREHVLTPVIPVKGLVMLYAWRGVGKTYVGLGMAYAIAGGIPFLKWQVLKARKVLYVDGEMPAEEMQDRINRLKAAHLDHQPGSDDLRILSLDMQEIGRSLNLADEAHQRIIEGQLGDAEVLFLDNRSTLVYSGRENDAESWDKMQQWFLRLRRSGKSVILVDHAGRSGSSRGTSKREDILDTIIQLKRPDDYEDEEGARFEVHLEKARGIFGIDAQPFEAKLETKNGADYWRVQSMDDINEAKAQELTAEGRTVREIAEETGISRSSVSRLQKKIKDRRDGTVGQNTKNKVNSKSYLSQSNPGLGQTVGSWDKKGGYLGQISTTWKR